MYVTILFEGEATNEKYNKLLEGEATNKICNNS